MKNNVSRLFALLLAVVMLVGILPLAAKEVQAEATVSADDPMTDILVSNDFETEEDIPTWNGNGGNVAASITSDATGTQDGTGHSLQLVNKTALSTGSNGATRYLAQPIFYLYPQYGDIIPSGNTYSMTVYVTAALGDTAEEGATLTPYLYLQALSSKSEGGSNLKLISGDLDTGAVYSLTWTQANDNAYRLRVMLGMLSGGEKSNGDFTWWVDNLVVTETWTVENALKYGRPTVTLTEDTDLSSFVQADGGNAGEITVAAGQTLDLNGYTLTATTINVEAGGKLTDSSGGKGRIAAAVMGNGESETIPVQLADGKYIIVTPKMTGSYVNTVNYTDKANGGFKVALRPGFGKYFEGETEKSVRYDVLANGYGDVSLKVSVAWADVYGQTGDQDVHAFTADEFIQVYDTEGGNEYFYTSFTNPGDSQYYNVTVSLVANGFTVSNTLAFNNKSEYGKDYLFAHNFDGEFAWNDSYQLASMRDTSKYISYVSNKGQYGTPTFDGSELELPSGSTHQLDVPIASYLPKFGGKLVIELALRLESGTTSGTRVDFNARNTVATGSTELYRQQILCEIQSSQARVGDHALPAAPGTASTNDCVVSNKAYVGAISRTSEYTTLKIELDYTNYDVHSKTPMTITVTVGDGQPVTRTIQNFNNTTLNIIRWTNYDGMYVDWMKVYHVS